MKELELPKDKKIILFDGVCNFCNQYVQRVIRWDKKNEFVFASLQSEIGQQILKHIGASTSVDSVILYEPGVAYYIKSDAIFEVLKSCHPMSFLFSLLHLLPKSLRDAIYDIFAKKRYRWFGKKEECMIPTPEIRSKFL